MATAEEQQHLRGSSAASSPGSASSEEEQRDFFNDRVPRYLRIGGLLALGIVAAATAWNLPSSSKAKESFLAKVSGTHFISEVEDYGGYTKYEGITCDRYAEDNYVTLEEAQADCGPGCYGIHSRRCDGIYGFSICDGPPRASAISSCIYVKPNTTVEIPEQLPPPPPAEERASKCRVALFALWNGMCPEGITMQPTCGPTIAEQKLACEQWFGSLVNVSAIQKQTHIDKCISLINAVEYPLAGQNISREEDPYCMECNMDLCRTTPTFYLEAQEASSAEPAVPSRRAQVTTTTQTSTNGPDGTDRHCRPIVRGQISGEQVRIRRDINTWNDFDFQIFWRALNAFRDRSKDARGRVVENEGAYPNNYGAFTAIHKYAHGSPSPGGPFLAWHRKMLFDLETQLQREARNCSLTLPYWNSYIEANNPLGSFVFDPSRYGGHWHSVEEPWAGGEWCQMPSGDYGYCLSEGIGNGWLEDPSADPRDCAFCVHRSPRSNFLRGSTEVNNDLRRIRSYSEFDNRMSAIHGTVHAAIINGNMAFINPAPKDPIFYLHHGGVDRLYEWWVQDWRVRRNVDVNNDPVLGARVMNFYNLRASEWMGRYQRGRQCTLLPSTNPRACVGYAPEAAVR